MKNENEAKSTFNANAKKGIGFILLYAAVPILIAASTLTAYAFGLSTSESAHDPEKNIGALDYASYVFLPAISMLYAVGLSAYHLERTS